MMKSGFRFWTLVVKMGKFDLVLLVKFEVESLFSPILYNYHVQTQLQFGHDLLLSFFPLKIEMLCESDDTACACVGRTMEAIEEEVRQQTHENVKVRWKLTRNGYLYVRKS